MELTVGITELHPQWSIVLDQIGAPYREINIDEPIDAEKYTALIISSMPTNQQKEMILKYLNARGAILMEANYAADLFEVSLKKMIIKYLIPDQHGVFSNIPLCDLQIKSEVDANAQYLANQNGIPTTSIHNYKNGQAVILPSNFCQGLIESKKIVRKNFPSLTPKFPSERVSHISTESIRLIVQKALIYLFRSRQLPFVQLWFFPDGAKNIFAFRIDTDSASKSQIEALYQLCKDNGISATWFMDTKSHGKWIDYFTQMENQEIGYHCYNHRIYPDDNASQLDMERGLSILETIGIKPKGYAAPFGEWNFDLGLLNQKMAFEYSSEFGCAYDDLPFFPYLGNDFSNVLQVPIHPISTRRLLLAKYDEEQMLEYYKQMVQQKLFLNEPIIFYHHPVHGDPNIFDKLFKEVNQQHIPNMSMVEYQSWWRRRHNTQWNTFFENGKLSFNSANKDSSIWVKAQFPDKQSFLMPLSDSQKQIAFDAEAEPISFDSDPKKLRRYTLRMIWQEIESYYGKLKQ